MKKISKYEADDGTEFDNEKECLDYENLIKKVDKIMSELPSLPKDDNCEFSNGGGFINHDKTILRKVQINILKEIKKYINHDWVQQTIDNENAHPSYVGRLIDEHYKIRPLGKAWYRFMCIDKFGREWGQVYFANNPEKGKQVCIGGVKNKKTT